MDASNNAGATPHARRAARAAWLAVAALAGTAACSPAVAGSGASSVRTADVDRIQGPYAPPGQRITVRLEQSIDTLEGLERGTFTARLVTPIHAADGRLIAPAGATVRGIVRSLGTPEVPRVRLRFDSVDTVAGPARLPARIRDAEYQRYPGPLMYTPSGAYGPYSGPYGLRSWGGGPGLLYYGAYDGYWDYVPYRPREVRLPAGARLELELTRPLVPPGTSVQGR